MKNCLKEYLDLCLFIKNLAILLFFSFLLLVAHHLIFDKLLRLFADLAAAAVAASVAAVAVAVAVAMTVAVAVAAVAAQIDWLPWSGFFCFFFEE